MNSLPMRDHGTHVRMTTTTDAAITGHRCRNTNVIIGRYQRMSTRLTGLADSRKIRPRTNKPIATGTSVTESRLEAAIANVLVNASGRKSRPSCPSRAKTGRNETVMISNEKKRAGPTSCAASTTTRHRSCEERTFVLSHRDDSTSLPAARSFAVIARSRCLCRFSIITIAASIMAPMAIAMPPSDMISAPTRTPRMAINAMRMPMGSVRIATSAERA